MSEREDLRPPPGDQAWMETESIGWGYGAVAWCFLAFGLLIALLVVLPLVLS